MEGLPLLGAVLFCHSPVFSRSSPLRHRALGGLRRRLLDTDGATMVRPPTPRLDPRTRTPHARLLCIHSATSAPCPRSGSAGAKYARCSVVCDAAALRDAAAPGPSPAPAPPIATHAELRVHALWVQGVDLIAGGRNKSKHRTAPKSENVYLLLLVKVSSPPARRRLKTHGLPLLLLARV